MVHLVHFKPVLSDYNAVFARRQEYRVYDTNRYRSSSNVVYRYHDAIGADGVHHDHRLYQYRNVLPSAGDLSELLYCLRRDRAFEYCGYKYLWDRNGMDYAGASRPSLTFAFVACFRDVSSDAFRQTEHVFTLVKMLI